MKYQVFLEKPSRKFIARQPFAQQKRILKALYKLPYEGDIVPMRGKEGQYRVRIGSYRAVYNLDRDRLTVSVIKVDSRGDVYKNP